MRRFVISLAALLLLVSCNPSPPPEAEATPPAPETPVQANIIFAGGSAEISAIQSSVIEGLAERAVGAAAVLIEGHTDTLGPADQNLVLSQARADAVQAALVSAGTEGSIISTVAFGETRPRIATPDETRNPINNRVLVTITP